MHTVRASARHGRALDATAELLSKLRIESMFVGGVARAAWLGGDLSAGSIDVLALMGPEQKNQVAMMASNRGFRVERDEVQAAEELDIIPLNYVDPDGEVRVHVLIASNALYGRMFAARQQARLDARALPVAGAEDLALLLSMADDPESDRDREKLLHMPEFDRRAFNDKLAAIGLGGMVVPE